MVFVVHDQELPFADGGGQFSAGFFRSSSKRLPPGTTTWDYHLDKNGNLTHLKKEQGTKKEEWDLRCGQWFKREWDAAKGKWGPYEQQSPGTEPPQDYPKAK